ncbi:hypothetical protein chiPu_0011384 [Chiloscyllium punctatum]|uniref:Uncharacterized protein n=1 Tax=Chiloscyllium punctatum TaxID=137246 RepID=A0A401SR91_CHIPU|nr:hypothetical protein [Chiloscyllium punctatum]
MVWVEGRVTGRGWGEGSAPPFPVFRHCGSRCGSGPRRRFIKGRLQEEGDRSSSCFRFLHTSLSLGLIIFFASLRSSLAGEFFFLPAL